MVKEVLFYCTGCNQATWYKLQATGCKQPAQDFDLTRAYTNLLFQLGINKNGLCTVSGYVGYRDRLRGLASRFPDACRTYIAFYN